MRKSTKDAILFGCPRPSRHFDRIPNSVRREPIRLTRQWFLSRAKMYAMLFLGILALFAVLLITDAAWRAAYPREQYPGQYAQVDPVIRQWFRDQKIPGTQSSCCSESDGVYAEEDIRDGHYWTRFVAKQYNDGAPVTELQSEWMQVPDDAVIHDPNRHGAPVVWWGWTNGLTIRCYSPGAGI